ncbi:MAG TPA: DUF1622 domain-containing protein [Steroidobacteraceae bacterium]|jgi:uncharacterized membrane protein|nr:DUF1622 domain-containing protein [Steroidobacteraceae bacterium]
MKAWLATVSEPAITLIDAIALLVILLGTVEVLLKVVRAAFRPLGEQLARQAWLRYARWLVAGLTFQLAADIIETSISTSWQTIGRVAAVAVIRTFLNYFLERDLEQQRRQCAAEPSQGP